MKRKHRIALGAGAVLLGAAVIVPTSVALAHLEPNNGTTTTASQSLEQPLAAPGENQGQGPAASGEARGPVGPHAQNKDKDEKTPLPPKSEKAEQSRPDAKPLEEGKIVKPSPKDAPRPSDLPPADNSNPGDDGTGRDGRTTTDESAPVTPLPQHLPSASL